MAGVPALRIDEDSQKGIKIYPEQFPPVPFGETDQIVEISMTLRSPKAFLLGGLLLVTFLAYSPGLSNGFTAWDDDKHVTENPQVLSLKSGNLKEIFTGTVNKTYIPLTTLSFAIEHRFFGLNPFFYHLDNLILHLVVVGCVFALGQALGLSMYAAFWAAAIFGIHPIHVESVAWITERKDVLYTLFYLLSLLVYTRFIDGQKRRDYGLALFFAMLSILAKPMALSLPLILLLLDWMKGRKGILRLCYEKIPFALGMFPVAWITYRLNARAVESIPLENLLTWVWSFSFYLEKFFWPNPLVPLYDLPKPVAQWNIAYAKAAVIFAAACLSVGIVRSPKWVRFALFYYFLSIFFLLRFDHTVDVTLVADRFMYLPSLGICFFIGWAIAQLIAFLREGKSFFYQPVRVIAVAMFAFLFFLTVQQVKIWRDDIVLFTRAIKHNPRNRFVAYAYYNRGRAYELKGREDLALNDYNQAIEIMPEHFDALNNRANLLQNLGQLEGALIDINRTIQLNPDYARAHNNRANILTDMGRWEEALLSYTRALELQKDFWQAFNNRGLLFVKTKEFPKAIQDFTRSLEINPAFAEIFKNRGVAYAFNQDLALGLADFDRAIQMDPYDADSYYNRGFIYAQMKSLDLAIQDYRRALTLRPGYPQAVRQLTQLEEKQK